MSKTRVGVVAFNVVDSFQDTLRTLRPHVDEIVVVYGRFLQFDHEWVDPPGWLPDLCDNLIISDHAHTQHEQRDLYLPGLKTGDFLFTLDCDWIPIFEPDVFERLNSITTHDSIGFHLAEQTGSQYIIRAYRYREGWKHGVGQMLQDIQGSIICNPNYRVYDMPRHEFFFIHDARKHYDSHYNECFDQYWKSLYNTSEKYNEVKS